MKRQLALALWLLSLSLLQACGAVAKDTQEQIDPTLMSGLYTYGHEVNTFQPCGQDEVFWVMASDAVMERLVEQHGRHTTQPYEAVFAEINGRFMERERDGFAMDYDGEVQITNIASIRARKANECK